MIPCKRCGKDTGNSVNTYYKNPNRVQLCKECRGLGRKLVKAKDWLLKNFTKAELQSVGLCLCTWIWVCDEMWQNCRWISVC